VKPTNFLRILAVSLALSAYSAWAIAQREDAGFFPASDRAVADVPLIRLAEAEALWRDGSALFVDVRSGTDYEFGHVAGAVSLPDNEFEEHFPALKPRLEQAKTLVVYCKSVDCGKSLWTALRLRKEGLHQVVIYPEGWNEWYLNKLPTAGSGQ
jgi:rhodanese-related sulfurtransferase